ncbi:MAG: preprotein translocase subunit YajC [Gammaproteobacteria bacterium]|nr:MAG: preprotein translocase subunit YajC [Gammaproteobacteria bacterium]
MNLFIADAYAQAADPAAQQGGGLVSIMMLVVMFVAFYFLLIRPQAKRAKEHKAMISALAKGDEVVAAGGVLGRVIELSDQYATVEIAEGVQIKVQRQAIQTVLPKGTLKSA